MVGAAETFERIVLQHERRIYQRVRVRCADALSAEALTQEVFVTAYREFNPLRGDREVERWLDELASRVCSERLSGVFAN